MTLKSYGSEVQDLPWLCNVFGAKLGYIKHNPNPNPSGRPEAHHQFKVGIGYLVTSTTD